MEMAYDKLDDEDHEGAIEAFRAATKFAPTKFGSSTWFNLGIALTDAEARGDKAASAEARKEAARAFQQAVKLDPKNEDAAEELKGFKDEL